MGHREQDGGPKPPVVARHPKRRTSPIGSRPQGASYRWSEASPRVRVLLGVGWGSVAASSLQSLLQALTFRSLDRQSVLWSKVQAWQLGMDFALSLAGVASLTERVLVQLHRSNEACLRTWAWLLGWLPALLYFLLLPATHAILVFACLDRIQSLRSPVAYYAMDKGRRCCHIVLGSLATGGLGLAVCMALGFRRPRPIYQEAGFRLPTNCSSLPLRWLSDSRWPSCALCLSGVSEGHMLVGSAWLVGLIDLVLLPAFLALARQLRLKGAESKGKAQPLGKPHQLEERKRHERTVTRAIAAETTVTILCSLANMLASLPVWLSSGGTASHALNVASTFVGLATAIAQIGLGTSTIILVTSRSFRAETLRLCGPLLPARRPLAAYFALFWTLVLVLSASLAALFVYVL